MLADDKTRANWHSAALQNTSNLTSAQINNAKNNDKTMP